MAGDQVLGAGHAGTAHRRGAGGGSPRRTRPGARGPWRPTSALRLTHPAELGELRAIRGRIEFWGHRQGLTAETLVDLQLAVGEAVSNGIEHAYRDARSERRPTVEVELELRMTSAGRAVVVRVADRGRWRAAPAEPAYRGRGLALIEELSNDLQVQRTAEGTQLRFAIPMAG